MNNNKYERYDNPLVERYASKEMSELFSPRVRIETWRKLWLALAECEQKLGLNITSEQIKELKDNISNIDWQVAREQEKLVRHDVMAHVHTYGLVAKKAAPIIHLGATSCYVTDNGDQIIYKQALKILSDKLAKVVVALGNFARKYKSTPTLGYTHFQPAQPTTVGKRACLWAQDFALDLQELETRISNMLLRGVVGTTGTQASFLALFNGNHQKCKKLNEMVCKKMGFAGSLPVTGQTYTRKIDSQILSTLAGIGESASKFATDVRLLANKKEIEEPFEKQQIGSSAMAYKRNPMRCERICSLSRYLITLPLNSYITQATQWLERTLDDSANRRIAIPQAFLAADAIIELCYNVASGLVVYPKVIGKNLMAELPFMATEEILMSAVKAGGDRQILHERIRVHSQEAASKVKQLGLENDLIDRLLNDEVFANIAKDIQNLLQPERFIGRSVEQVEEFIEKIVLPINKKYKKAKITGNIRV